MREIRSFLGYPDNIIVLLRTFPKFLYLRPVFHGKMKILIGLVNVNKVFKSLRGG